MNPILKTALTFIKRPGSYWPSFTALVSLLGVSFGVAAFLVVVTVFNSFEQELRGLLLAANPNVFVVNLPDGIKDAREFKENLREKVPRPVKAMSLFEYNEVILSKDYNTAAVILKGIEGEAAASAPDLSRALSPRGILSELNNEKSVLSGAQGFGIQENQTGALTPPILLGKGLALKLNAKLGEEVTLVSGALGAPGGSRIEKFKVVGLINLGLAQYDDRLALINFHDAVEISGRRGWSKGIEIQLEDPNEALYVSMVLRNQIPYQVRAWQELNRDLFDQIERDGMSIKLIVLIITLVAAFNIIVTLRLSVLDRAKQIALLRSLGATRSFIVKVFVLMGTFIGLCGAVLGVGMGLVILRIFAGFELGELQSFYFLERLPVNLDVSLIFNAILVALFLSFFSALYPAYQATRVSPLHGLKANH